MKTGTTCTRCTNASICPVYDSRMLYGFCQGFVESMDETSTQGDGMDATYIEVSAEARYWEDATVNGVDDTDGSLIPLRFGALWTPVIRLCDGYIMGWPKGVAADIHYKVCDQGEYWLLDSEGSRIAKWAGDYVPDAFLCHGDRGYGDYIILKIGSDGKIVGFKSPEIQIEGRHSDERGWSVIDA